MQTTFLNQIGRAILSYLFHLPIKTPGTDCQSIGDITRSQIFVRYIIIDNLQNRLKELQSSLEAEKRTNEGQIAQILRLNEEVILSVDEKTKLQEQISELEQEIHRLEDGMKDPKNYYREEMQKVTDPSPSKS